LVNRIMDRLTKSRKLPKLPKKFVAPTIITGVEALARGNDLQRLDFFLQGMSATIGSEAIGQFVNLREYIKRRATALGIDLAGLIKTEEELAAEAQQAQQQQAIQQFGPQAIDIADRQFREAQQIEAQNQGAE